MCQTVEYTLLGIDYYVELVVLGQEAFVGEILGDLVPEVLPVAVHDGQEVAVHDLVFGSGAVDIVQPGIELSGVVLRQLRGQVVQAVHEEDAAFLLCFL